LVWRVEGTVSRTDIIAREEGVLYLTSQEFVEGSNLKHECYYRDMASYVVFGQQILRTKGTVTFEHVELRLLCALCCVLCKFVCFYSVLLCC
jgi:hypothetical protein